jgi:hypothetical protein
VIALSVEKFNVVDIVIVDPKTDRVVLTISDHLEWGDTVGHQTILQGKFNAYLAFVESGEILQAYPDAKERRVTFRVVFKYCPDPEGEQFLLRARKVIEEAGFELRTELFGDFAPAQREGCRDP